MVRGGPLDTRGGAMHFFEKNSLFPNLGEKNSLLSNPQEKNSLIPILFEKNSLVLKHFLGYFLKYGSVFRTYTSYVQSITDKETLSELYFGNYLIQVSDSWLRKSQKTQYLDSSFKNHMQYSYLCLLLRTISKYK